MERVGRYEILEKLGQGGQSVAFKARDPGIDRLVAIKLVRDTGHLTDDGRQEFSARFQREAQAAGRLSHPNIATIYDMGESEGRPYIAMEYVEGETLNQMVRRRHPLEPAAVVELFQQLCAALQYAHDRGVVHRDIKPENIMVTREGQVKVVDFGVARIAASTLTQDGSLLGTPSYMSPEQVQGQKVDRRSDIFSLGVVLYEALTGERPFEGEHPTTVIFKIVSDQQRPAREVNPDLDSRFDDILSRALAKKPEERYSCCAELSADLADLLDTLPTLAPGSTLQARIARAEPADLEPTLVSETTAPPSASPGKARQAVTSLREPAGLLLLGGLLGALVLVGLMWWATRPPAVDSMTATAPATEFYGPLPPGAEPTGAPASTAATSGETSATALAGEAGGALSASDSELAPIVPPELRQRALGAFRGQRFEAAAADFRRFIEVVPDDGEAHYFLGMSLARTEGAAAAVPSLLRAVELRSEDPLFRIQLGMHLDKAGRGAQAAAQLKQGLELGGHPDFEPDTLRDHILRLELGSELAGLVPFESNATHDHFIRGCEGRLSLTRSELNFVTEEESHSLQVALADLRSMTSTRNRLEVVLPDGKNFNFDLEDARRAARIYAILKQLTELPDGSR